MVLGNNRAIPHPLVPKLQPFHDIHYQASYLGQASKFTCSLKWHFSFFQGIGNSLGRFLAMDPSKGEKGIYTYGRICTEIDISKGLTDQINLKFGDFH